MGLSTWPVRNTLLTGVEVQHQSAVANRATTDLQSITNIFAPVTPETSREELTFLRDAKHSSFLDVLRANYEGFYATDQLDLTSRWKLRVGGRQAGGKPRSLRKSMFRAEALAMIN